MLVPNVGMAILAVVASLEPVADVFNPYLDRALHDRNMAGVPDTLKYHSGYKKWRYEIGGTWHTFASKEDALMTVQWTADTKRKLDSLTVKVMQQELSDAGQKSPRLKPDVLQAMLRLRYKLHPRTCICCTGAENIPASEDRS